MDLNIFDTLYSPVFIFIGAQPPISRWLETFDMTLVVFDNFFAIW